MGLQIFATPDPDTDGLHCDGLSDEYDRADAAARSKIINVPRDISASQTSSRSSKGS